MANWLLMFRPDTYATVKDRGVIGVLHQHRTRFASLSAGDRFVAYISRSRLVDGHGRLAGDPYVDVEPIWSTREHYPQRCEVAFDRTGAAMDATTLLWHLDCWPNPMKTTPSNYLFCKGGFLQISDHDRDFLIEIIEGRRPLPKPIAFESR